MDFNLNQNLWDLSLPPQLPQIDDSDFLTLLSKQLHSQNHNAAAGSAQPPTTVALQGISPPVSEDSSPSPPAQNPRGLITANSSRSDDMHKRKVADVNSDDEDEDDIEGQPLQKSQKEQHKKGGTKRKSTGGDETRQTKRKEQNRAAQRAFRERKEKHVKDLEDKVAQLEQKFNHQATENENLRDLLGRLQNENLMLKQSAFTFSFPQNASSMKSKTSVDDSASNSSPSLTKSSASSPLSSTDSPATGSVNLASSSGAAQRSSSSGFATLPSFSSMNGVGSSNSTVPSSATSMSYTSLFSPPPPVPVPSPYTTIISNPMYTSYMDIANWDHLGVGSGINDDLQLADAVGLDIDMLNTLPSSHSPTLGSGVSGSGMSVGVTSTPGSMEDLFPATGNFSELNPFSAFAGGPRSPLSNSPTDMFNQHRSPVSPIPHTPFSPTDATSPPSSRQPSVASAQQHTTTSPSSLGTFRTQSPCGGAGPDEAPLPGSSGHDPLRTTMNINGSNGGHSEHGDKCPRTQEDIQAIIQETPLSTLGAVPGPPSTSKESMETDTHQMELNQVWQKIKAHPQFEECDMDQLCSELTAKVKCSGGTKSKPVMDAKEQEDCLSKLVENVVAAKKEKLAKDKAKSQDTVMTGQQEQSTSAKPSSGAMVSTSPTNNVDFMFNPFLPMSYQQNGVFQIPGLSVMPSANTNSTDTSLDSNSGFGTLGGFGGSSNNNNTDLFGSSLGSGDLTANGNGGFGDVPMDMPSPGSFTSLLSGMGGFSPSAYLAFDE